MAIPELGEREGSWVITPPGGKSVETFSRAVAARADTAGWVVESIGQYLTRINRAIRAAATG